MYFLTKKVIIQSYNNTIIIGKGKKKIFEEKIELILILNMLTQYKIFQSNHYSIKAWWVF